MKRKSIKVKIIIGLLSLLISSCSEHTEPLDYSSLKVGNILLADARVIPLNTYSKSTEKAIGVIFAVQNDTAYVASLKELGDFSYCDSVGNVANVDGTIKKMAGLSNTAALMDYSLTNNIKVPAATAAVNFSDELTGWYLPSCGELKKLSDNLNLVKNVMNAIGGDRLSDEQYVSSSQDGTSTANESLYCYSVCLKTGYVTSTLKSEKHRVRPVIIIR